MDLLQSKPPIIVHSERLPYAFAKPNAKRKCLGRESIPLKTCRGFAGGPFIYEDQISVEGVEDVIGRLSVEWEFLSGYLCLDGKRLSKYTRTKDNGEVIDVVQKRRSKKRKAVHDVRQPPTTRSAARREHMQTRRITRSMKKHL